ncbi:Sugar ABC transporter permease [Sulfidibacter corallicola]|uniref:Sugar ABC transporter permease n=1 Tax=Sulfidibacter corallicola TaxID=2818388 RepID=A0A8A4TRE1_SULCO|nr:sugar ABC transporter permease [Sulfidibacter corallicola]QTD52120.1 sugar ABC transporter permease [Sulfidibacter corallicola]
MSKNVVRVTLGLLVGGLVAALLGHWFAHGALKDKTKRILVRHATVRASALADLVGAQETIDKKSKEAYLRIAARWGEAAEEVEAVRVLRLSGSRLLASSFPEDAEHGAAPRRLKRAEKALYDRGQLLRANIDTNRQEQLAREEEVMIEWRPDGAVQLAVPFFPKSKPDRVAGYVEVLSRPRLELQPLPWWPTLLLAFIPALLYLIGNLVLAKFRDEDDANGMWGLMVSACLLLATGLVAFGNYHLIQLGRQHLTFEQNLAARYMETRGAVAQVGTQMELGLELPFRNTWDLDLYGRPHPFISFDGELYIGVDRAQEAVANRLGLAFFGNAGLAFALLFFFGFGGAALLWRTLVDNREAYVYTLPALIGMLVLVFFPFSYGIALSFTDQNIYNTDKTLVEIWIGLNNYIEILGDFNLIQTSETGWNFNYENFYWTLFITVAWTICNVTIGVSVGLTLALLLNNKRLRFKPLYRGLLILPWAIPNYVTSLIWKGMFNKESGPINQIIQMFGGEPLAWFDSVFTSFLTGVMTNGWLSFPFMMVTCLGGLQSISSDMYEAARLDGASKWQQFRYITLPSLKPTLTPAVILSVVWTFNMFNVIYLVSGGDPGGSNEILITKAYKLAFQNYQYGYSAAYSTVIFAILLIYGIFQSKAGKAAEANA